MLSKTTQQSFSWIDIEQRQKLTYGYYSRTKLNDLLLFPWTGFLLNSVHSRQKARKACFSVHVTPLAQPKKKRSRMKLSARMNTSITWHGQHGSPSRIKPSRFSSNNYAGLAIIFNILCVDWPYPPLRYICTIWLKLKLTRTKYCWPMAQSEKALIGF